MNRELLSPDTIHKPTTYYSHAAIVDDVIYLAGQAPHDKDGTVWDPSDPAGQVRSAFENLEAVLKAADASFNDVVCIKVLLRRPDLLDVLWEVGKDFLASHRPAITVAVVSGLADSEYLIEFDAIAVREHSFHD